MKFRYEDGAVPNGLAIAYAVLGWAAGVAMITWGGFIVSLLGMLLLAHALVVSAYLIHECTHGAVFAKAQDNDRLGLVMAWLNGACVAPYAGLKEKHLRHHADRMDVVTFDYRALLKASPAWFREAVLGLEWAYIPAVEFFMRGMVVATPFIERDMGRMAKVTGVLAVRVAFFIALGSISIEALVLYFVAYVLFLHVLRFQDAFQHTYEVYATRSLTPIPAELRRDRAYEHANTYSDVVSYGIPWTNILVLNFPYHNAHHAKPAAPWYKLGRLHDELYGRDMTQVLPCAGLLKSYHDYRVSRVLADDYGFVGTDGDRAGTFLGAVGVSFLTAV